MPEKTAANIFITEGLKGGIITPFKHSMYRPMLYVDIDDVCKGFEIFAKNILNDRIGKKTESLAHIVNLMWPRSMTILDLARVVRETIIVESQDQIKPEIEVVDKKRPTLYSSNNEIITVDCEQTKRFFELNKLTSPQESIARIVRQRFASKN